MGGIVESVIVEDADGGIRCLALSNPRAKNAMDAAMRDALARALEAAARDDDVRAVILTGVGTDFCAGGDIRGFEAIEATDFRAFHRDNLALLRRLAGFDKPVVVALRGAAAAGGAALALAADVIVASASARIGFPFLRIGLVPDMGSLATLPERVGLAAARRLFLTGRMVEADEAARIGLVDAVCPDDALDDAAHAQAIRLAGLPTQAFALTKRLMREAGGRFEATLEAELEAQSRCFGSDAFRARTAAFLGGRPPR